MPIRLRIKPTRLPHPPNQLTASPSHSHRMLPRKHSRPLVNDQRNIIHHLRSHCVTGVFFERPQRADRRQRYRRVNYQQGQIDIQHRTHFKWKQVEWRTGAKNYHWFVRVSCAAEWLRLWLCRRRFGSFYPWEQRVRTLFQPKWTQPAPINIAPLPHWRPARMTRDNLSLRRF